MRTTYNDIKAIVEFINDLNFITYHIRVSRRNGYYAIEGYNKEDVNRCLVTLHTGMNARECYLFLHGMRVGYFYTKI